MSFDSSHIPSPSDDFLYHQPADHWAAYDQALALQQASMSLQFNSYPSTYPQPRLTPPPAPVAAGSQQNGAGPRLTLAGSLDPTTGIFYRTPEHPRLRTAQACEKCRTRKAKCSGEHPSCKRCQNRGLVCEYAKEGRVRGPNKPKNGKVAGNTTPGDELLRRSQVPPGRNGRGSEPADLSQAMIDALREHDQRLALTPMSRRGSLSMGEHRPNRPRPPNLDLDLSNHHHYRLIDGHGHYSQPIPGTIPVSYHGLGAYEENRSPSSSSSASGMHLQNTYLAIQQQHTPMGSATNSPPSIVYHDVVPTSMQGYHGADVKSPVPVHSHGSMANIDATLAWVGMGVPAVRYGNGTEPALYPLDMQME